MRSTLPRRLSRAAVTGLAATTRFAGEALRSLAVMTSLSFVILVTALLTVAGGAEAATPPAHHAVKSAHARKTHRHRHHKKHRVVRHAHRTRLHSSGRVSPQRAAVVSGAAPCPNATMVPTAANVAAVDQATLCLVNQQRRANGLAPLVEDTRLDQAAQAHSNDMVGHGYFEHVSPSGSSPLARMMSAGFLTASNGYEIGENIAWGTLNLATPASIVNSWMHSPDHRANILDHGFRKTGMGITPGVPGHAGGGQAGATYTQDFGTVLG